MAHQNLTQQIESLQGQKKFLQATCRRAGKEIYLLKDTIDKLENLLAVIRRGSEENKPDLI